MPKWVIILAALLREFTMIAEADVASILILSNKALQVEAKMNKRMVEIKAKRFWETEEANDVNFHGKIDVGLP